jgi:hypothetical protein
MSIGSTYIIALLVGLVAGVILRWRVPDSNVRRNLTLPIDKITIRILLPCHIVLTTQLIDKIPTSLWMVAGMGCFLPVLTYFVCRSLFGRSNRGYFDALPLVAASFGGGNRGVLFLAVLIAFHIPSSFLVGAAGRPTLYDHFALMDLYYFIVFTAALPHFHYRIIGGSTLATTEAYWLAVSTILTLTGPFLAAFDIHLFSSPSWLNVRTDLSIIVTISSTMTVVSQASFEFASSAFRQIGIVLLSRLVPLSAYAAIAVAAICWFHFDTMVELSLIIIPLGVFLLVPPSSYVVPLISQYDKDDAAKAASLAFTWNILYLILVSGAVLAGLVRVMTTLVSANSI